jgi:hypothetical protein
MDAADRDVLETISQTRGERERDPRDLDVESKEASETAILIRLGAKTN